VAGVVSRLGWDSVVAIGRPQHIVRAVPEADRRRELGRGERTLPGVWRLRLPLPWPGVPHGNAWAVAAGDGVVLFDCGMHEPGSRAHLERALHQVNLRLEHVRLLVCTHAHSDHCGQAGTVVDATGAEVWMHPDHGHLSSWALSPDAALERRYEIGRTSGVPAEPLRRALEQRRASGVGLDRFVTPARDLVAGVRVSTDLGEWEVVETPGHAPSHVSLFEPTRRVLISGDHLLGRVSLYFDFGSTPDPVGEFLGSLDRVEALDARLVLPGHGRTFTDVQGHIDANRRLVAERLDAARGALARYGPASAFDLAPHVYGEAFSAATATWLLTKVLCWLAHLEGLGEATRDGGRPERWATV
jgi:glyoxylase-like metal-dependent hydrolase (beta-lactamase superfamily II)